MESKKPTARKQQADKTRTEIYNTAVALMEKKGYAATTIGEIMSQVGVSVGTFYHYFKSKEDIFFELFKKADEYFEGTVASSLRDSGLGCVDQIVLYFKYYAKYNNKRGFDNISQLYNTKNKYFTVKGRYMQRLLEEVIARGRDLGELDPATDPAAATEFLFIAARGVVYDWCIHEGKYSLERKMVEYISRLVAVFRR